MLSKNAINLLKQRYCRNNEEPIDVYRRTARVLSDNDTKLEENILSLMSTNTFLPNSPALFNSGYSNMLHACCALGIEDNIQSIADFEYRMTMMFKYGAGVGANYSYLRSKDTPLSSGGSSSGVVSLLEVIDKKTDYIKQGGYRRGASMAILSYDHPEIVDFCQRKIKGGLTNMNLSVLVNDNFMKSVKTKSIINIVDPHSGKQFDMNAYDLFDIICFCAWSSGCPGLLFFDRINKDNKFWPELVLDTTNPCSESPIPKDTLCCLGSINLSKFVRNDEFMFERFEEVCRTSSRALLNMNKVGWYPFDFMKESMDKYNPVGLGIMGFADTLIKLGIYYDSEEALSFIDNVGKIYKNVTDNISPDSFYHRIIAPTGSLSILADCSSSIEPVFSEVFESNLTVGKIEEAREIYKSKYCRTAHEIDPMWHLKIQAQWQKWADGGISKTINLPHTASIQDVKDIYFKAWELGIKGITIYRDNSKTEQPLNIKPTGKCDDGTCYL
jgi:ribonucleoside-diphosphate reductase alpha chain